MSKRNPRLTDNGQVATEVLGLSVAKLLEGHERTEINGADVCLTLEQDPADPEMAILYQVHNDGSMTPRDHPNVRIKAARQSRAAGAYDALMQLVQVLHLCITCYRRIEVDSTDGMSARRRACLLEQMVSCMRLSRGCMVVFCALFPVICPLHGMFKACMPGVSLIEAFSCTLRVVPFQCALTIMSTATDLRNAEPSVEIASDSGK